MGIIEAIHIARAAGAPTFAIDDAYLRIGAGIDGDRYGRGDGTFSSWPRDHELTLIEGEVVDDEGFAPGESRRNLTTRGIRLNELVGQQFRIGGVLCVGTRLCEPCATLERVTERPGVVKRLLGRGGLRAKVLEDGPIRVGDRIIVLEAAAETASVEANVA